MIKNYWFFLIGVTQRFQVPLRAGGSACSLRSLAEWCDALGIERGKRRAAAETDLATALFSPPPAFSPQPLSAGAHHSVWPGCGDGKKRHRRKTPHRREKQGLTGQTESPARKGREVTAHDQLRGRSWLQVHYEPWRV